MCSTIGAAFGGAMAVTTSSGPGIALKGEAMGLAMMLELPMLIINVQRGGPSTGLPTKTEQSDLLQAMFGRNGECPMPVIAARSPADCFDVAQEAWRIAVRFMTPVMLLVRRLHRQRLGTVADPPSRGRCREIHIAHPPATRQRRAIPAVRARRALWLVPGPFPARPGLMHRIGGLEKQDVTGNVSYDPDNHQHMVDVGPESRERRPDDVSPASGRTRHRRPAGAQLGRHLRRLHDGRPSNAQANGLSRWPTPTCATSIRSPETWAKFISALSSKVLIPELNMGQLRTLIAWQVPDRCRRAEQGPRQAVHRVGEIVCKIEAILVPELDFH